ncbi:MAG: excalibur calcium-binding domain-containing protein [Caldilineaceae bacterium]|nr:excalibur calcium-binding domain-containing protein [Caldilineaceae bacterium]
MYNLSMDEAEASVARRMLADCSRTAMQFIDPGAPPAPNTPTTVPTPARGGSGTDCARDPLGRYDDNNIGRITCAEARRHGIAPVPRGHPAYMYMRDGDSDVVVCE